MTCYFGRENTKYQTPTQWNYMRNHYVEPATNYLADEESGFKQACYQILRCMFFPIAFRFASPKSLGMGQFAAT